MPSKRKGSRKRKIALLLKLYDGNCFWCGKRAQLGLPRNHPQSITLDELLPLSRGGLRSIENQVLAHKICNNRRSNMVAPMVAVQRHHAMLRRAGIEPGNSFMVLDVKSDTSTEEAANGSEAG